MKRFILTTILGVALTTSAAYAQETGAKTTQEPTLLVVQAAPEDDAAHRLRLAQRFIELMQVEQMGAMMQTLTVDMIPPSSHDLTAREHQALTDAVSEAVGQMMPRIFEAMAPIYADLFTLDELQQLVAFYESPIGRTFVTRSFEAVPALTEAMNGIMPDILNDMATSLCESLECTPDELREVKAQMGMAYPAQ